MSDFSGRMATSSGKPELSVPLYGCPICPDEIFNKSGNLQRHLARAHLCEVAVEPGVKYIKYPITTDNLQPLPAGPHHLKSRTVPKPRHPKDKGPAKFSEHSGVTSSATSRDSSSSASSSSRYSPPQHKRQCSKPIEKGPTATEAGEKEVAAKTVPPPSRASTSTTIPLECLRPPQTLESRAAQRKTQGQHPPTPPNLPKPLPPPARPSPQLRSPVQAVPAKITPSALPPPFVYPTLSPRSSTPSNPLIDNHSQTLPPPARPTDPEMREMVRHVALDCLSWERRAVAASLHKHMPRLTADQATDYSFLVMEAVRLASTSTRDTIQLPLPGNQTLMRKWAAGVQKLPQTTEASTETLSSITTPTLAEGEAPLTLMASDDELDKEFRGTVRATRRVVPPPPQQAPQSVPSLLPFDEGRRPLARSGFRDFSPPHNWRRGRGVLARDRWQNNSRY